MGAAFGMYQEYDKRLSIPEDWRFYRGETDMEALIEAAKSIAENALAAASRPLDAYPVGAIYLSYVSTSPASLFGGTWTQLKDRFLVGAGSSYGVGATGGETHHVLTWNEMPSHNHGFLDYWNTAAGSGAMRAAVAVNGDSAGLGGSYNNSRSYTASAGSSWGHENRPPYLAVYMWRRTA